MAHEFATDTPFRRIEPDFAPFLDDLGVLEDGAFPRERLLAALKHYLAHRDLKADWQSAASAPAETLVNALAMLCPFEPAEKQALLEAPSMAGACGHADRASGNGRLRNPGGDTMN